MRATIPTAATDYPNKVVRMIEPFGPGSGPEVIATAVSRKLAELWGQPVTVENHPGAGSTAAFIRGASHVLSSRRLFPAFSCRDRRRGDRISCRTIGC
jgi:tripartite-type tricarboxylate transporter receptor subunit TctC